MPYRMNAQQFENVLALSSEDRFIHFIGKVADWQELWGITIDDNWMIPKKPDGPNYIPVWPHPEYAEKVSNDRYPESKTKKLEVVDFIENWIPIFDENNVTIAIFPDREWVFWAMKPNELGQSLNDEIAQYE